MEKISTSRVVKIGIVSSDAEATANRLGQLFDAVPEYDASTVPDAPSSRARYKRYHGKPVEETPMKVRMFYIEPVYFEIIQPLGDAPSPWRDHLAAYGTSVCFLSFYIDGFERHLDFMNRQGYPLLFEEEKGYERYAYFDTMKTLGFTLEMKERAPQAPRA